MSKRIKKMSWEEFTAAAASGALAAGAAFLVLAPEKHSPLSLLKKPAAKAVQMTYNDVIPKMAELGSGWIEKSGLATLTRNKVVDILYDTLSRYDGVMLAHKILQVIPTDKYFWTRALDHFLDGILDGRDGREQLSNELAAGIASELKKALDGSAVSVRFNKNIEKTIQTGISEVIDTLLTTSVGNSTMNMVLDGVKQLQDFNVGGILEKNFDLDKQGMSNYLDSLYSRYVGKEMVENLEMERKGDALADQILNVDTDELRSEIKNEHMDDVVDLVLRAASAGITLYKLFGKKK